MIEEGWQNAFTGTNEYLQISLLKYTLDSECCDDKDSPGNRVLSEELEEINCPEDFYLA